MRPTVHEIARALSTLLAVLLLGLLAWVLVAEADVYYQSPYDGVAFPCDGQVHGVGYNWGGVPVRAGLKLDSVIIMLDLPPGHIGDAWYQSPYNPFALNPVKLYGEAHGAAPADRWLRIPWTKDWAGRITMAADSYLYAVCSGGGVMGIYVAVYYLDGTP